ncbi:MAG: dihydromonapterin reductase, partial [Lysobacterales bacterium]
AHLYCCDFYDEPQVDLLIRNLLDRFKSLRAIIHNASDWLPDGGELSAAEVMRRMMQVHVTVPYRLNLALLPRLRACATGRADIIHVGDYVSGRGSRKHIAYAASKAAQDNLTLSFAARFAPEVKVNSIAPALLLFNEHDDKDYRRRALAKSLMPHEGGLEEFQRTVDFLLESNYVTGRILHLDGGRHLR